MEYQCGETSKLFTDTEACSHKLMSSASQLWDTKEFSDFTVVTSNGTKVKAHKVVLAAQSPFFKVMFNSCMTEAQNNQATINMIPSAVLMPVLEYMYKNVIEITTDNVHDLLEASNFLIMDTLKNECELFVIHALHADTAIYSFEVADKYYLEDLKHEATLVIQRSFKVVAETSSFLDANINTISQVLSSDQLSVSDEAQVFDAVLAWIEHDENGRKKYAEQLLKLVRFVFCSLDFISEVRHHKYMASSEMLNHLLTATLHKTNENKTEPGYKWKTKRDARKKIEILCMLLEDGEVVYTSLRYPTKMLCGIKLPGSLDKKVRPIIESSIFVAQNFSPSSVAPAKVIGLVLLHDKIPTWQVIPTPGSLPVRAMTVHEDCLHIWCTDLKQGCWVTYNIDKNQPYKPWCTSHSISCFTITNMCIVPYKNYLFRIYCDTSGTEAYMMKIQIFGQTERRGALWDIDIAARVARCLKLDMVEHNGYIHISTDMDYLIYNPETDKIEATWQQLIFSSLLSIEGELLRFKKLKEQYKIAKWLPKLKRWMPQFIISRTINNKRICQISKLSMDKQDHTTVANVMKNVKMLCNCCKR